MRVRLKLMANFPHVQILDITFMEKPIIDYVLKPVGGEHFGFDIANVSQSPPTGLLSLPSTRSRDYHRSSET